VRSYYRPDYRHHQEGYRRERRRRWALAAGRRAVLAGVAAAAALALAVSWSALGPGWVRGRLAAAGLFRVEGVEVRGNRALPAHLVEEVAGVARGGSLLAVDLDAARARLEAHPRVRAAAVRRRFPRTLVIEVAERVPAAVVRSGADYVVDREGAVLERRAEGTGPGLPVLTGVETAGGALTPRGRENLAAGLALVDAIRAVGFPALEAIGSIDVGAPEDAVIVPVTGRPLVHAGRGDATTRLARWRLVAPDMASRWPEVEYVDLRADGQVIALPVPGDEAGTEGEAGGGTAPGRGATRPGAARRPSGGRPGTGGGRA